VSARLRVGVVGCGGIAQMMHLPTLAERPDLFEITALADPDRGALEGAGRRYHVEGLTADFRDVVARPDVDAVLLCASGGHREAALAALAARKHLFVEKPLAFSLEESEEIAAAARRAEVRVMVGYHKRHDPAYRRACEELREIRGLRFAEVTVLHPDDGAYRSHHAIFPDPDRRPGPPPEAEAVADVRARVSSGDLAASLDRCVGRDAPLDQRIAAFLLYQSLIHDINAIRGALGEPEEVISAHVWCGGFAQTSLTRFPGDVCVSLTWISLPGLRSYEERLLFVGPERRVTLTFPSPYLRHAPTPLRVERMDGSERVVEERTVSYEEAFRTELHHFRGCVLEDRAPETPPEDAVADARWIRAIAAAWRSVPGGSGHAEASEGGGRS
jgi:predicted dehydrogenase